MPYPVLVLRKIIDIRSISWQVSVDIEFIYRRLGMGVGFAGHISGDAAEPGELLGIEATSFDKIKPAGGVENRYENCLDVFRHLAEILRRARCGTIPEVCRPNTSTPGNIPTVADFGLIFYQSRYFDFYTSPLLLFKRIFQADFGADAVH